MLKNFLPPFILATIFLGLIVAVFVYQQQRFSAATDDIIVSTPKPPQSPQYATSSAQIATTSASVKLATPQPGAQISSPLLISGKVDFSWTFEGQCQARLETATHQIIAIYPLKTSPNVDENGQVSFKTSLNYTTKAATGFLTIKNDNPSGLPEFDFTYTIPVRFY